MRIAIVTVAALLAVPAFAALPPAPESARIAAAEAKAKADWADKDGAYRLCLAQDRVVDAYRRSVASAGETPPAPVKTAACTDPGPYATPERQKPLEASGAHSPTGTAAAPPSKNVPAGDLMGQSKKP